MTTTPTDPRRLAVKIKRQVWRDEDHPRDRKGRFIETGAEVRVWGGFLGKVIRNIGGGRLEIERLDDGKHVIVHRNYLTVTKRPDGSAPTKSRDANPAPLVEDAQVDPDAQVLDVTTAPDVDAPKTSRNLHDALVDRDPDTAATVRQAAADYQAAIGNGVPDDEADERDGLLDVLDDIEAEYPDDAEVIEGVALLRAAAEAEPPAPGSDFQPSSRRVTRGAARTAEEFAEYAADEGREPGYTVDGEVITITDPRAAEKTLTDAFIALDGAAKSPGMPAVRRDRAQMDADAIQAVALDARSVNATRDRESVLDVEPASLAPERREPPQMVTADGAPAWGRFQGRGRVTTTDGTVYEGDVSTLGTGQATSVVTWGSQGKRQQADIPADKIASVVPDDTAVASPMERDQRAAPAAPEAPAAPTFTDEERRAYDNTRRIGSALTRDQDRADALAAQGRADGLDVRVSEPDGNGFITVQMGDPEPEDDGFDIEPPLPPRIAPAEMTPELAATVAGIVDESLAPEPRKRLVSAFDTPTADAVPTGLTGTPEATGDVDDPIDVGGDLDRAATLIGEGKHVRLNRLDQVGTLVDRLGALVRDAEANGDTPKVYDLCLVSVPKTNLFCQQNQGIARVEMPQFSGVPIEGTPAFDLPRNERGRVNLAPQFIDYLNSRGVDVEERSVPASWLKASQRELDGPSVAEIAGRMRTGDYTEGPMFVTRDGYVIDGHHRWAAKITVDSDDNELGGLTGQFQDVRMLDVEIGEALDLARAFTADYGMPQVGIGARAEKPRVPLGTRVQPDGLDVLDALDADADTVRITAADVNTALGAFADTDDDVNLDPMVLDDRFGGLLTDEQRAALDAREAALDAESTAPPLPATWADVVPGMRVRAPGGVDATVSQVADRWNGRQVTARADNGDDVEFSVRGEGVPEPAENNPAINRLVRGLGEPVGLTEDGYGVEGFPIYAPSVGTWLATAPNAADPGFIGVRTGHVDAEMRATTNGWVGRFNPGRYNREGITDWPTFTDRDPQVVMDQMYDWVNGDGRAALSRSEATAGRTGDIPEVGPTWQTTNRLDVINVDGEDRRFLYHRAGYSYGGGAQQKGYITHVAMDDDPEAATTVVTTEVEAGSRPTPGKPALGDEAPTPLDGDVDAVETEYVPDVQAVSGLNVTGGERFRPTGIEDFAQAGTMTKLDANLAALDVLNTLRAEGRPATADEQATLARWAGWGGLSGVFDETKPEFAARRERLYGLLSESEIKEAKRNTLNAHYTDAHVVQAVWKAVGDLGFSGGRVLEPGSGSGTFVGFAPDNVDMVGVELDSTTAAISKALYPDAVIRNESFAETNLPEGAVDGVIGNVPFGRFKLNDPIHNPNGDSIHNHFIGKSLAFTRPGGIVAVLSSRYTLDGLDADWRKRIAEDADFLGAVRLPNGSHQRVSGTDVIEDVLLFRKRMPGEAPKGDQSWINAQKREINGWNVGVNDYFIQHPEHVLGDLTAAKGQYGGEVRVEGDKSMAGLDAALADIVTKAQSQGLGATERPDDMPLPDLIAPGSGRYEGQIAENEDGTFTIARTGASVDLDVTAKDQPELRALLGIRDAMMTLLDAEAADGNDTPQIAEARQTLNDRYDAYVGTFGPINRVKRTKSGARQKFSQGGWRADPKSDVVAALENYTPPSLDDPPGSVGTASKAAIFTTRAVAPRQRRTTADNPADALTLSMDTHGRVDLPAIARMLDTDEADARRQLGTLVYDVPPFTDDEHTAAVEAVRTAALDGDGTTSFADSGIGRESLQGDSTLVPAAEYLSGNVRQKLAAAIVAADQDPRYAGNVEALRGVVPRDLGITEVEANLGATWIDAQTVQDFVNELARIPRWENKRAEVAHSGGNIWRVDIPDKRNSTVTEEWGTEKRPLHQIVQALLEQRQIEVTTDGKKDTDATLEAQAKAEAVADRFREWVWEDPDRSRRLLARYNDLYNSIALRKYDGSAREFEGMSEDWRRKVMPHVKDAVERIVNEPTAMLAHVVGAGKTAEMVMGTAELKRLGMVRKPAVVVPNHMLNQFTREYLEIYPAAKILTAGQGMSAAERREFVARAATGDWDAVIMTQGAFEGIPMGEAQVERYIDRELGAMRAQLDLMRAQKNDDGPKNSAANRTIKAAENSLIRAEEALRKRLSSQKDLGVSFEQTGIDYLMVDEAHMYSNLRTLSNIQAAGATGSNKATDLHMKMEWLRETSKSGRVATFATGTPIRNTVTQAYIMQKFLRPDLLEEAGIHSFDQWAATFGQVVDEMELKPEGNGFRQTQRFAKFRNVPEFLRMFHTFADVKMRDDLNLPTPKIRGGKAEVVAVPRSQAQADYIMSLGERADDVRSGQVDPTEDNMLKISTDGRKAALSMALVTTGVDGDGNPTYGTHEPGKIEAAAERIAEIHDRYKDTVYTDPKTGVDDERPGALQIVFMDLGTPKGSKVKGSEASVDDNDTDFSGYDLLKDTLVSVHGIDRDKIRFIHEAKNDAEKAEMFAAAKDGRISVLIGSSDKMGVGTNMQRRAKALHHLDAPWRPADVEQRDGRIERQGNLHMNMGDDVEILRYVTEGSFDAYMWQTLERKAKFINQIMKGSLDVREIEDVGDTAMSYAEVKALALGKPDFLDKAKADTAVTKLSRLARTHAQAQTNLGAETARLTGQTEIMERNAVQFDNLAQQTTIPMVDLGNGADGTGPVMREVFTMDVRGETFQAGEGTSGRSEAGEALRNALTEVRTGTAYGEGPPVEIGRYNGHTLVARSRMDTSGSRVVTLSLAGSDYEFRKFKLDELRNTEAAARGIVASVDNFVNSLGERAATLAQKARENRDNLDRMTSRIGMDFPRQAELDGWKRRAERLGLKIQRDEARGEGQDIPFDPTIDSDQYDDPIVLGSSETVEAIVPEEVPAEQTVLASDVGPGDNVSFVFEGSTVSGRVVSMRSAAGYVFLKIMLPDGTEVTRALLPGEDVNRYAGDAPVTGVKGMVYTRRLTIVDGRVTVEVKAGLFGRSTFDEAEHPRDRKGRFIEVGGRVEIWGGAKGIVSAVAPGGRLKVQRDDGVTVTVDAGNVTVLDEPDVPAGTPQAPGRGSAPAAPATPDPAAGDRRAIDNQNATAVFQEQYGADNGAEVGAAMGRYDQARQGGATHDEAIATALGTGAAPAAPSAPAPQTADQRAADNQNATAVFQEQYGASNGDAIGEAMGRYDRARREGSTHEEALAAAGAQPDLDVTGSTDLSTYATSEPQVIPETFDAEFTGPDGQIAALGRNEDTGEVEALVQESPDSPWMKFDNADDWATYVDSVGFTADGDQAAPDAPDAPDTTRPAPSGIRSTPDGANAGTMPPPSEEDVQRAANTPVPPNPASTNPPQPAPESGEPGAGAAENARGDNKGPSVEDIIETREQTIEHLRSQQERLDAVDLDTAEPTRVPNLSGGPLDPKTVADLRSGSAADHLVENADGTVSLSPERQELHRRITALLLDEFEGNEANPKYHVMGGGPAAGKSTMENALPEISEGKAVLNADVIKEMLPEFLPGVEGSDEAVAGLVHEESSFLVKAVMAEAFARRISVTLDGTGDGSAAKMKAQIKTARDLGYEVNGYYVTAESDEAVRRAIFRATKTGRAVPESVIRDTHIAVSNIFEDIAGDFDNMVLYDTQAPKGPDGAPALIGRKEAGGEFTVADQPLYDKFLDKRNEAGAAPAVNSEWLPYDGAAVTAGATTPSDAAGGQSALSPEFGPASPAARSGSPAEFGREDGIEYDGDPVDDDVAYMQHAQFITETVGAALKAGESTDKKFSLDGKGAVWSPERAAIHKEILDSLYAQASGVPNERRAVVAGGLGGAGKSTVLKNFAGIDQTQYLTLNPDDIKELMVARGDMLPEVEGLAPMESIALIHEESSYLTMMLAERAYADGKNVIWDITMASEGSVSKRLDAMAENGYEDVQAVFVDIPIETSVERALSRHRNGMARHRNGEGYGGRFVPPAIIRANADDDYSSANRRTMDALKARFTGYRVYDNSKYGQDPVEIESGGTIDAPAPDTGKPQGRAKPSAPEAPDAPAEPSADEQIAGIASMSTAEIEAAIENALGPYLVALRKALKERKANG